MGGNGKKSITWPIDINRDGRYVPAGFRKAKLKCPMPHDVL